MIAASALWIATAGIQSVQCQERGADSTRLVLLDGSDIAVTGLNIRKGELHGQGVPPLLQLDDLRSIDRPAVNAEPSGPGTLWVELRGGRIAAQTVSISNEKCRLERRGEQSLELPLDAVRSIGLLPSASAEFDNTRANPAAEQDRVLIRDASGAETLVAGLVESLTNEQLQLDTGGAPRSLPRTSIVGIVFAQPAPADSPATAIVHLSDESVLAGTSLDLNQSRASLLLPGNTRVAFRWDEVSRVIVNSTRVAFLSDLQPVAEKQRPIVTPHFAARRDRSVTGRTLRLGSPAYESRVYEKGLGVHAYSELPFATSGKWDRFVATIGLDPDAGSQGDCVFKVLADEREIFTQRLRAADSPQDIDLPITGRQQVVLKVEPGEGLDLGDHANWCDARLVKNKP
jgi:hypothetical protein